MSEKKLCLGLGNTFGAPYEEQISLIKNAGFDGVFIPWSYKERTEYLVEPIKKAGLEIQSCHAPFNKTDDMWDTDREKAEIAVNELIDCVHFCSEYSIPIMVSHAFIGFDSDLEPNEEGLCRYEKIIDEGKRCGVKIAFENTEGEEFLRAILSAFGDGKSCGFCLDTGHEMCYNRSRNLLAEYGDMLLSTHINDNLGISDKSGRIYWTDDLHLLPFDGVKDWPLFAKRLASTSFDGFLTFELCKTSKPGRQENDVYDKMELSEYLTLAFERARRIRELVENA